GPVSEAEKDQRRAAARLTVAAGCALGAFDGAALVGSARYLDLRQWWHGRPLPMAGVAGVKVAPHEQGRGLGRLLMTAVLEQTAERGYPLSALFPATASLYRSLGWELAGGRYEVAVPTRSVRALLKPDPAVGAGAGGPVAAEAGAGRTGPGGPAPGPAGSVFRPAGPADASEVIDVLSRLHAAGTGCGPVTFDEGQLALALAGDVYLYLAPDGVLGYRWDTASDEVHVYWAAAGSAATTRAMWSIVSSHRTIVRGVRAVVSPDNPVTWLTAEPDVTLTRAEQWMLRLLDAPAAVAGRGFPPGASLSVPLAVTDSQLPGNSGHWQLEVSRGAAALTPARPGSGAALRLGARGLAALYAGTPLATLRLAGLAAGGTPDADAALDAAFTATPYMTDSF
ncbi:MAG TPA: GNAT family N-acetyltransferase, partial [Streptosporangiaceae bacterium]|nr:GNAT family N-acetyltransferase [Streptosporangiaceae bacterium]